MTSKTAPFSRATCASVDLPAGEVPEWVHLLPAANGEVRTHDGRGPYRVTDPAAIIAASLNSDPRNQGGLIIDENHSSDLAAPVGGPSPSRGRITAMEARADGIWGRVDWTAAGRALMADRAYRGISPVITYDKTGTIHSILRAGLVNYPNLHGLTALNSESPMDLAKLMKALGLSETATMDDAITAIAEMKKGGKGGEAEVTAMQASLTAIGTALGVTNGDATAILAAVNKVKSSDQPAELVAMQAEMATMTAAHNSLLTSHTALQSQMKREKAEAFVDKAIAEVRSGIKPQRDYYIARHMEDPTATEAAINAIQPWAATPKINPSDIPRSGDGANDLTALNAEQQGRVLADRAIAYQAEQKTKGLDVTFVAAIAHIKKDVSL